MYILRNKPVFSRLQMIFSNSRKYLHIVRQKYLPQMISAIKKIYSVISVISTLTLFSAFFLFLIGKLGIETSGEDDLIMENIRSQVPDNLTITEIILQDIHGFGNDSVVVLAAQDDWEGDYPIANQMLIFDRVDNDILSQVYNLFGYGSSFKLSYMFSLQDESYDFNSQMNYGYSLDLLDVVELTGDLSKELVVMFMAIPSGSSGYYQIGIFSYSFETHSYFLLGTYPPASGYDLDSDQSRWSAPAPTVLHSKTANQYNYYDKDTLFELEFGTSDDNDFYIVSDTYPPLLVRTCMIWGSESHVEPHRHIISVFRPKYNHEAKELEWTVIFSKETTEYVRYCTEEFVIDFLKENNRYDIVKKL